MFSLRRPETLRKLSFRSLSNTAAATITVAQPVVDETIPTQKRATLATVVSPSASFVSKLSLTHFASFHNPPETETYKIKNEILHLIDTKKYDTLLRILIKWTSRKGETNWTETLTHNELTHILSKIISYQIGLITRAGTAKMVESLGIRTSSKLVHAHSVREKIRTVYANLLFTKAEGAHLYSKAHRSRLVTAFELSPNDYENLISMELNNGKLDLASKWFQRFEQQHPNGTHYKYMTSRLWLLKFQVYASASPALWKVELNDLYEVELNPRQSRLMSERGWLEIFNDFISNQAIALGNVHFVFDRQVLSAMLFSIAYSKNVEQLTKLIELNWGINSRGKMVAGFSKLDVGDPLYPDLNILKTIVVSMIFNKQYVSSMAYMNGFQEHYGIDLSKDNAKHFWDLIFRWCEIQTRFSEFRALQHFIQKTATTLLKPTDANEVALTLEEAQKSADFDYEGYLKFIGDLRNQRNKLIEELWKGYRECLPGFSARVYKTYLTLLSEDFDERRCYEYLSELALQYHLHDVSPNSFNRSMVNDRLTKISQLYERTMKLLIDAKGSNGDLGQIRAIISKWALNEGMRSKLDMWALSQEARFLQNANEKKTIMEQSEEEEDGFLGLMS